MIDRTIAGVQVSVIVEEGEFVALNMLRDSIADGGSNPNDFLPLDEYCLPRISGYNEADERGMAFSARINDREVARVAMFVRNHQVFVGGSADFFATQDIGIRRALLAAVESKSKFLGIRSVSLYTSGFSLPSIALYKTLGYYFSGQRKLINGAPLLHMEKKFE
ncbi:MAG: GNAT family N-acetyltransferase [Bacteroidetes bacterium]|nr:GNAT family N-acetyltransferase [Bacteroidota bacterium]